MEYREKILETALDLFYKEGYENVGVQKIVETVGITKPTLYHYFENKKGLLQEVLYKYYGPFLENLRNIVQYNGDINTTIQGVFRAYISFYNNNRPIFYFYRTLKNASKESEGYHVAEPLWNEEYEIINQMFIDISKQHTNLQGKSQLLAMIMLGMIDLCLSESGQKDMHIDNESFIENLWKQFMYGIFSY